MRRHSPFVARVPVGLLSAVLLLAGCAIGERPTLVAREVVADPAVDAVLSRLRQAESVEFTATYDVTPSATGVATEATITQAGERRRVIIGDIDYAIDGGNARTCRTTAGGLDECADEIDEARISDLNITHRFWGSSFATRLELDANRNLAAAVGTTTTIVDRPAACADVPIVGGQVTYCALDAGVLARYFGADVSIELTSFTPTADPDLLPE